MSTSYRTTLVKAQDYLAFDTSCEAGIQRDQIANALNELRRGVTSPAVEATVVMAELIAGGA